MKKIYVTPETILVDLMNDDILTVSDGGSGEGVIANWSDMTVYR